MSGTATPAGVEALPSVFPVVSPCGLNQRLMDWQAFGLLAGPEAPEEVDREKRKGGDKEESRIVRERLRAQPRVRIRFAHQTMQHFQFRVGTPKMKCGEQGEDGRKNR